MNMESKEIRIARLKKQILEIENEGKYSYELVKIIPDCGGGIKDYEEVLAISNKQNNLINFCQKTFSYSPSLTSKRPDDDRDYCKPWYKIQHTLIKIL